MITTEQRKHVDSSILTYLPPDLRLGPWHEGCMVQGLWHMTGAKVLIENGEAKKRKPLNRQKTMRVLTPMRPVEVELELSCAANHFLANCMMKHAAYCEGHHIPPWQGSFRKAVSMEMPRLAFGHDSFTSWVDTLQPCWVADCACVNYLYSVNSKF